MWRNKIFADYAMKSFFYKFKGEVMKLYFSHDINSEKYSWND